MTADAFLIVRTVFRDCWALFTSWNYPGTNVSPAEMAFLLLNIYITFKFFLRVAGLADFSSSDKN